MNGRPPTLDSIQNLDSKLRIQNTALIIDDKTLYKTKSFYKVKNQLNPSKNYSFCNIKLGELLLLTLFYRFNFLKLCPIFVSSLHNSSKRCEHNLRVIADQLYKFKAKISIFNGL